MSWDFIVPVCLDDLVKSGAVNQYVVQDVLSVKQLPSHINSKCCWALLICSAIHFTFCSVVELWNNCYFFLFLTKALKQH